MVEKFDLALTGCDVVIHFRDEMSGGADVYTRLTGDEANAFITAIACGRQINAPKEDYSIHLSASHQIVLESAGSEKMQIFYDEANDWLIAQIAQQKGSNTIMRYYFFRPDPVFHALLDIAAEKRASTEDTDTLQTSSLVLRASITSDMLAQAGTVVDYELYTGSYAYADEASLYHIYTSQELPEVVEGSTGLLVASLGACPTTGYSVNISQIDYTDHLIRVFLHVESPIYPDDEEVVQTYPYVMATCDLDDFPLGLTVAFIDQNYNILDVQTIQMP
ncbi:MAG: protease complex subunit PrcB family protein [Clostridia bacterium]|nr:protease complex subunit PrcB family protein [Clostridia bacterium]